MSALGTHVTPLALSFFGVLGQKVGVGHHGVAIMSPSNWTLGSLTAVAALPAMTGVQTGLLS